MKNIKSILTSLLTIMCLLPALSYAAEGNSTSMAEGFKENVKNAAKNISEDISDATITTKIKAMYALESDIPSMKVSVSTKEGVVSLSGQVDTRMQANTLVDIAKGVKGVSMVNDSKLEVTKSEHYFNDALTTLRAKIKILGLYHENKIASGYNLHVETTNGDVHIHGAVKDSADSSTIKSAISDIKNVKDVYLNIKTAK